MICSGECSAAFLGTLLVPLSSQSDKNRSNQGVPLCRHLERRTITCLNYLRPRHFQGRNRWLAPSSETRRKTSVAAISAAVKIAKPQIEGLGKS